MRLHFFYIYILTLYCTGVSAQGGHTTSHTSPGSGPARLTPDLPLVKGIYCFPSFTDGTVVLRNGMVYGERLNYNVLDGEMCFINQKGDTLFIADPVSISFISLQGRRFYYEKRQYLQTLSTEENNPDITLAMSEHLFFQHLQYDANESARDTVRGRYFTGDGRSFRLKQANRVRAIAQQSYFFGDKYGHFTKAGKSYLLEHYPQQQTALRSFIKLSRTDFNNREDLLMILQYCSRFHNKDL